MVEVLALSRSDQPGGRRVQPGSRANSPLAEDLFVEQVAASV